MPETIRTRDVSLAADLLTQGRLVAFATETVYGLGADAKNSAAVAGIFESKRRPRFDPLIVHVADTESAQKITTNFFPAADLLAERFWPGPLTLVLPKHGDIPDLVTAGLPGVGVRVPAHDVARELISTAGCPVAAPSANPFGRISPTTAAHVLDGLNGRIDAVLDGGPCPVGVESTVVSLMNDRPLLLRPGGLPVEDIEAVVGPLGRVTPDQQKDDAAQAAPGMLSRHYAPSTRLVPVPVDAVPKPMPDRQCGLLTWGTTPEADGFVQIERLSDDDNLRTCAAHFFAALRKLDATGVDVIMAREFPALGLGVALNDRLKRAAVGSAATQNPDIDSVRD